MQPTQRSALVRVMLGLMLAQSLSQVAYNTGTTITTLTAVQLSGQKALAGLAGMTSLAGAALAAYPAGKLMAKVGRRNGLTLGAFVCCLGAGIAGFGVIRASFPGFLWGLFVLGMGRATLEQSRFAVAEINATDRRARAMSIVIWGATIGAVIGPLLAAPTGNWALSMGLNTYAGPLLFTSGMYVVVGAVLFAVLSVDWKSLVAQAAAASPQLHDDTAPQAPAQSRSFCEALREPAVFTALLAMMCGQAAMVLLMASVSLHMNDHNHGLGDISAVISVHVLGMFALSPLVGQLADRWGRRQVIALGAGVLMLGCVIAPLSYDTPWIALAQFCVGLGWSGCYVAGSALLTDALGAGERARLQGANDTVVNLASAAGSLSSGLLLAVSGFALVSGVGFAVALLPLLAAAFMRPALMRPARVS